MLISELRSRFHRLYKVALRRRLRAHIKNGGLIAYATASCFGLGCDPGNPKAIKRLLRVKSRPQHKGLILIAQDFDHLSSFVTPLTSSQRQKAEKKWPGPHTWLMSASPKVFRSVRGRSNKVAVRVDAHPDAVGVCRIVDKAVISTSLNRSGRVPVRSYREARRQFGGQVLVLPGRISRSRKPSTIQDFTTARIVRK